MRGHRRYGERRGAIDAHRHDQPQDQRDVDRRHRQSRRHGGVQCVNGDRLLRSHAPTALAPLADRSRRQDRGRPPYRPAPHGGGHRHRDRRGGGAGARRQGRHPPLRRRALADGRDADPRRGRHFGAALPRLQDRILAETPRRDGHRDVRALVPQLRAGGRDHAARRDALRFEQTPYRRERVQGARAAAARGSRNRPAQGGRDPEHQGGVVKNSPPAFGGGWGGGGGGGGRGRGGGGAREPGAGPAGGRGRAEAAGPGGGGGESGGGADGLSGF